MRTLYLLPLLLFAPLCDAEIKVSNISGALVLDFPCGASCYFTTEGLVSCYGRDFYTLAGCGFPAETDTTKNIIWIATVAQRENCMAQFKLDHAGIKDSSVSDVLAQQHCDLRELRRVK